MTFYKPPDLLLGQIPTSLFRDVSRVILLKLSLMSDRSISFSSLNGILINMLQFTYLICGALENIFCVEVAANTCSIIQFRWYGKKKLSQQENIERTQVSSKPNNRLLLTGHSCYFACFNLVTNKVQVDNQPLALANAPSSFWLDLHCLLSVQESVREVRAF